MLAQCYGEFSLDSSSLTLDSIESTRMVNLTTHTANNIATITIPNATRFRCQLGTVESGAASGRMLLS